MPTLRSQIELDTHDRALITVLQQDGRIPFVELARRVGLSEKTVRSRVTALLDSDVIRIVALTSPRSLGFNAIAMVGLTTDPAVPATDVARDIAAISGVDYVVVTTGRYSVIVEVITTDRDALRDVIEKRIGATPGVRSMEIFPGFSLFYQKARFLSGGSDDAGVRTGALPDVDRQIAFALSGDGPPAVPRGVGDGGRFGDAGAGAGRRHARNAADEHSGDHESARVPRAHRRLARTEDRERIALRRGRRSALA